MYARGIYCIEGEWFHARFPYSVKPILTLLSESNHPRVPFMHRNASTPAEVEFHVKRWPKFKSYPILYLAFHGHPGKIVVEKSELTLDWFEKQLAGKCANKIVHFGSCWTLKTDQNRLKRFLKVTKALAVTGYRKKVDWLLSTGFDMFLMSYLQQRKFNRYGFKKMEHDLRLATGKLPTSLGFWMVSR